MEDGEEHHNPKAHKKLLMAIGSLGNSQHIQKSTRDERQTLQDEFQLGKSVRSAESHHKPRAVGLNDLVQILRTSSKHIKTGRKLKNIQTTKKVLEKPLEKPAADRIRRAIGYEGVTKKLGRWDAVVAQQRSAETQIFPIPSETIYVNTAAHAKSLKTSIQSALAKELEASKLKLHELRKAQIGDTADEKALAQQERELRQKKITRDELFARRKELAYLKMRESQKSAKSRVQNKIKSKKFHKLQKRQKIHEQMKEFELLQKTNPEAALEKLNALEKIRVQERASLRHKNTGTWAKNLQMRAKYDRDVRKDLAEQLAVGRQLTEKKQESDSETEFKMTQDVHEEEDKEYDPFNPWIKRKVAGKAPTEKAGSQVSNWRKYWTERNQKAKFLEEHRKDLKHVENVDVVEEKLKSDPKPKPSMKKVKKSKVSFENGWEVEKVYHESNVTGESKIFDNIFEGREEKLRAKLTKKLENLKLRTDRLKEAPAKSKKVKKKDSLKNLKDLAIKMTKQRVEVDEPLYYDIESQQQVDAANMESDPEVAVDSAVDTIDLSKVTTLLWAQKERSSGALNDALTISQAFEDDDIIADFNREKTEDSELKNTELQLAMPGWGSWAGAGISQEVMERRNKRNTRLLLRLAAPEKRRDDNKDNLFINETSTKHARQHMVSSVPFPFRSLADYEASIRAPIGRNFVPETAFRMLTRPSVITRKGQVIEPMDDSDLVKPERRLRNIVDKRIKRLPKVPQNSQKAKK
ncbi:U3 small nucleolar RNA-associated protein 14 homolog A isoform X2 [Drosophila subobscura]|uniref:U3 small nucleolar RNA-associated protein 14 homolog A isoform X2 n=1 Tax=Drosophila subobscura TaxID=7241 RepID=UPI00155A7801|nr:U3 small nucleolar RNA-associated protein 14 homolog A isoform X2 [Drosophila subobscura]